MAVQNLRKVHTDRANGNHFPVSRMEEPVLQDANESYVIHAVQGDSTTAYGAGNGVQNRDTNNDGWSDLDLRNTNDNPIHGFVQFKIYADSGREDLVAKSAKYRLSSLRSAVSESRTDKVLIPSQFSAVAGMDSFLTAEVSPDPESEGDTVSKANSTDEHGLAYSELK